MYKRILVAIDVSDAATSRRLAAVAADLAKAHGGAIHVVSVRLGIEGADAAAGPAGEARSVMDHLLAIGVETGLPPERVTAAAPVGGIAERILAEADAFGADLLVIGPHKHSLAKLILGSNANAIVRNARVSVLVAR